MACVRCAPRAALRRLHVAVVLQQSQRPLHLFHARDAEVSLGLSPGELRPLVSVAPSDDSICDGDLRDETGRRHHVAVVLDGVLGQLDAMDRGSATRA
jgi:hypothetical protein